MWYEMIVGSAGRAPHPFVATVADFGACDWLDFHRGVRIDEWDLQSSLCSAKPECDGTPDDVLANAFGLPVFSEGLRAALACADVGPTDIQYLPVRISRSDGAELSGYCIANVASRLCALNPGDSVGLDLSYDVLDSMTGKPKVHGIQVVALKSEPLVGHDAVRLLEFLPPVFVSARFVAVFDNGGFTGVTFNPVVVA